VDRERLHPEQQDVHHQGRRDGEQRDERDRLGGLGRAHERQQQHEREREVEGEAPGGDRQAHHARPRAARDLVAPARLARAADLVDACDGARLAVVLEQQQPGDSRRRDAQDERRHDPLSRARVHPHLPKRI
jgi:hypothetical protein